MEPNFSESLKFLKTIYPAGPWMLTAITPHQKGITAKTYHSGQEELLLEFLERHRDRNLYYSVNEPAPWAYEKIKLEKTDILRVHYLHVDIDPEYENYRTLKDDQKRMVIEKDKAELLARLTSHAPAPTIIINSGGGYNALWKLKEPVPIAEGLSDKELILERAVDIERYTWQLETELDADNTRDVSRILRLPHTLNYPTEAKLKKGRPPDITLTSVVSVSDETRTLGELRSTPKQIVAAPSGNKRAQVQGTKITPVTDLDKLNIPDRIKMFIVQGHDPDKPESGSDRSKFLMYVCCCLIRAQIPDDVILGIILNREWAISAHPHKEKNPERAAIRALEKSHFEVNNEPPPLTDAGNAQIFMRRFYDELRWVPQWKSWVQYNGTHWVQIPHEAAMKMAVEVTRKMMSDAIGMKDEQERAVAFKWAIRTERESALSAMVKIARGFMLEDAASFDSDRYSMNVLNGTLDLRTGILYPHSAEDYHAKLASVTYDAHAQCPVWDKFITWALPNETIRDWMQKYLGYCLTGNVGEQIMVFLYGEGANGKSTLLETMYKVMGDYAKPGAPDLLLAKQNEAHPAEIADIHGARMVVCQEIDPGRSWSVSAITRLTGADQIKTRHMHGSWFEFSPTHKFIISANHKPKVKSQANAIWRRMRIVPFKSRVTEDEMDIYLGDKLANEVSGILRWMVHGCQEWLKSDLKPPQEIRMAVQVYKESEDMLGQFLDDVYIIDQEKTDKAWHVKKSDMYNHYLAWCKDNGEEPWAPKTIYAALRDRGFEEAKIHGTRLFKGLQFKVKEGNGHAQREALM